MITAEKFDITTVEGYKIYVHALCRVKNIKDTEIKDLIDASVTIDELQIIENTLQ